jgi:hypothetical protein
VRWSASEDVRRRFSLFPGAGTTSLAVAMNGAAVAMETANACLLGAMDETSLFALVCSSRLFGSTRLQGDDDELINWCFVKIRPQFIEVSELAMHDTGHTLCQKGKVQLDAGNLWWLGGTPMHLRYAANCGL